MCHGSSSSEEKRMNYRFSSALHSLATNYNDSGTRTHATIDLSTCYVYLHAMYVCIIDSCIIK